ncbi:hypothetical protein, partial [Microbacterium sp.]|uniref:hypothetical protein n=1 Tax=Microbacterium sp. TaxID=51671 RepID=UPI003C710D56
MSDAARSSGVGAITAGSRTPWFLTTPPESTRAIARPRVTAELDRAIRSHRVVAVGAPSGFGKSTAVAEWARQAALPVAWLSLTRYDGDIARITHGVVAALRRVVGHPEPLEVLSFDPTDVGGGVDVIAERLRFLPSEIVLVVDQAEFADDLVDSLVAALAVKQPSGIRLVVLSTAPAPDVLRALGSPRGGAAVGPGILAFDSAEIALAGCTMGIDVTADRADEIRDRTGGWPVAVRIELGGAATDDSVLLDQYIDDAILRELPDPVVEIVRATTIVSTLDGPLAAAISGRADAAAQLEECVRRGLFLDRFSHEGRRAYVWHDAFRTAVTTAEERRDPDAVVHRHLRAAEALRDSDPLDAIEHYVAAGAIDAAYTLILESWLELLHEGRAVALDHLCAALPRGYAERAATLGIRACCAWT